MALLVGCADPPPQPTAAPTHTDRRAAIEAVHVHLDAGRVAEALAISTRLVEAAPNDPRGLETDALVHLSYAAQLDTDGRYALGMQERGIAFDRYDRACANAAEPGLLYLSAGQIAQVLGWKEDARRHYEAADLAVPDDPRASFFLGQMALLESDHDAARIWLVRSNDILPNEPTTVASLALVEFHTGNSERALELAAQACALRPDDYGLRIIQARIVRVSGDPARAIELLSSLPSYLGAYSTYAGELGESWLALDRPLDAAAAWITCYQAAPTAPEAWRTALHVARALDAAGDEAGAAEWSAVSTRRGGEAAVAEAIEQMERQ